MAELFDILGRAVLQLLAPTTQTFNDTTLDKVNVFDDLAVQRGNLLADVANDSITINADGLYEFQLNIDAELPGQEELDIHAFINGVDSGGVPASIQGGGNGKPVSITLTQMAIMTAGDVVDIRIKNGDPGNVNVLFRRLFFSIKADS